jgi:hypothetical protein
MNDKCLRHDAFDLALLSLGGLDGGGRLVVDEPLAQKVGQAIPESVTTRPIYLWNEHARLFSQRIPKCWHLLDEVARLIKVAMPLVTLPSFLALVLHPFAANFALGHGAWAPKREESEWIEPKH